MLIANPDHFEVSTLPDRRTFRAAAIAIAAILLTCPIIALFVPQSISSDAAMGFRVWNSMARGAPVNHFRVVSTTDISRDADHFLATFSPGQYMIPGLLMRMGSSLRWSLWLITAILTPLAVAAYYYLYRSVFLFTPTISILSCLAITTSRQTMNQFSSYSGGPFLQFVGFPILLLACIFCIRRSGVYLCLLPFLFLAGAFLKLSFAVIALSLVASVSLKCLPLLRSKPASLWIVPPLATLLAFVTFYATLYTFFSSRGWSSAQYKPGRTFEQLLFCLFYSTAAPMSGIASVFSSLAHLGLPLTFFMIPDPTARRWFPAVIVLATASVLLLCWTYRRSTNPMYRAFLIGFFMVHVCSIALLSARAFVSLEDRHFWPASAVLLPGVFAAIQESNSRLGKSASIFVFAVLAVYGISSYAVNVRREMKSGRSSAFGVTLPGRNQRLIDTIEGLDGHAGLGRTVFYLNDPVLGMLVRHHAALLEPREYLGTTDRVILVVDRDPGDGLPDPAVRAMFKSYDQWQWTAVDSTDFYCAGKDPLPLLNLTALPPPSR